MYIPNRIYNVLKEYKIIIKIVYDPLHRWICYLPYELPKQSMDSIKNYFYRVIVDINKWIFVTEYEEIESIKK